MNADVFATVLTGVGVLIGVWRIVTVQVDSVRRDLAVQIGDVRRDLTAQIGDVRRDLTAQIGDVNTRIDNILLAERKPAP